MLTDLFPSTSYLLAYALPLLFISIPLAFAGAFLTLDRTRVFTPRKDAGYEADTTLMNGGLKKSRNMLLLLEGGLGGLAGGYVFGLLASTFLVLVIPAETNMPSLGHKTFIAVWVLSVLPTTFLGGRWRYAALPFLGMAGGATLALALSIIIHPSLIVRVVFISVFTPLLTLLCTVPIKATQHVSLRVAAASTGSFGLIIAIALLSHQNPWSNVYTRLWTHDGAGWGTRAEQGLSAGYCLFLAVGCVSDWYLHRRFGENPDQRWDAYLADYATNLPNGSDRAGVFEPLKSPFARLLRKNDSHPYRDTRDAPPPTDDDIYPDTKGRQSMDFEDPPPYAHGIKLQRPRQASLAKSPITPIPEDGGDLGAFTYGKRPGFLKKKSTKRIPAPASNSGRKREGVKFRPLSVVEGLSSDSDSEDERLKSPAGRPWNGRLNSAAASLSAASGTTMNDELDVTKERAALAQQRKSGVDGPVDYSDYESDGSSHRKQDNRGQPGWSPEFIRRASQRGSHGTIGSRGLTSNAGSTVGGSTPTTPATLRSVPATPSLIRAVDRLAAAQEAVYGPGKGLGSGYGFPAIGMPVPSNLNGEMVVPNPPAGAEDNGERWASFWRDVKDKADRPGATAGASAAHPTSSSPMAPTSLAGKKKSTS